MKTLRLTLTAALLLGFLFVTNTSAQVKTQTKAKVNTGKVQNGPDWIDANGDGICDKYDPNNPGKGLRNGPKDGSQAKFRKMDGTGGGHKGQGNGLNGAGHKIRKGKK